MAEQNILLTDKQAWKANEDWQKHYNQQSQEADIEREIRSKS